MASHRVELPDNLPACHAVIIRQAETIERLELRIDQLSRDVTTLKRELYGSRRERFWSPSQDDSPQATPPAGNPLPEQPIPASDPAPPPPRRTSQGRRQRVLDATIPREHIMHRLQEQDVPPELWNHPQARRFFRFVREEVELQRASVRVYEHYQEVLVVDDDKRTASRMLTAQASEPLIERCYVGPAFLAYLATSRFADHIPYYREEEILARTGFSIHRATQWRWMRALAKLVLPLVKRDEARATYMKAVELDPNNAEAQNGLAAALLDQYAITADNKTLEEAIELEPTNANYQLAFGCAMNRLGKRDEAVATCMKAIELEPRNAEAHNSVGHALCGQNKVDDAIVFYKKATKLDPKYSSPHYNLGLSFASQNKLDEAVAAFKQAIELDPNNASSFHRPHYYLGIALARQNKLDEAIRWFRRSTELTPQLPEAHASLAWHLATAADPSLRDHEAAVVHARKSIELAPNIANNWSNLGVAFLRVGDFKSAIESLEKANALQQGGNQPHSFFLAMTYWQSGEQAKARLAYDQAVKWMEQKQPNNEEQRRFRAEAAELLEIAQPLVTNGP